MKAQTLKLIALAGGLNFLAFLAIDFAIGGDALGGKAAEGKYYLNQHGTLTQVSHAAFIYSAVHAYSALFGLVVAFAAARALKRQKSK